MSGPTREAIRPASEPGRQISNTAPQRCACGGLVTHGGECRECRARRLTARSRAAPIPLHHQAQTGQFDDAVRSPGQPLDRVTRAFMEDRFGHDFSTVRLHSDERSARAANATAFTIGEHIVLSSGLRATSGSQEGRSLLGHELAHVVQQRQGSIAGIPQLLGSGCDRPDEIEAGKVARLVADGRHAGPIRERPGAKIQRKLHAEKPKDPIPNPGGKGLSQTNAATVEGYLQTLCADGSVTVDKGSGEVKLGAGFCPKPLPANVLGPPAPAPADTAKEPAGCGCICDMVASARAWTILIDDVEWPHTLGQRVTAPSPNSTKLWGAATVTGKAMNIDPWLVLGHELCGHAWLDEKKLPDTNATRGEGGHQETVARENLLRAEHGIEARGSFKDPYCGESFWQTKAGPGPVQWSSYMKKCEAWRKKSYGSKYKISDKIP